MNATIKRFLDAAQKQPIVIFLNSAGFPSWSSGIDYIIQRSKENVIGVYDKNVQQEWLEFDLKEYV